VNVNLAGSSLTNGVYRLRAQTMNSCDAIGGSRFILNNYRSTDYNTSTGKTVVYFDRMRIGTTRAAVEQ